MGLCSSEIKVQPITVETPKSANKHTSQTPEDTETIHHADSNEYMQQNGCSQTMSSTRKNKLGENLELYSLVWCDANVNETEENQEMQIKLRSSINYLQIFDNADECEQYIKQIKLEKVVLIVSGRIGPLLVPRIHDLRQLTSIYVYCENRVKHENWAKDYNKVAGVVCDSSTLLEKVSKDQKSLEEAQIDSTPLSFFDPSNKSAGNSLRSLTTENGSFLYFQLLISVLLRMEPMFDWQKTTKNQLVQLCKENYKDNTDELKVLDEFDQTYTSSDAIRWYTRECCIYKLLNKALRFQDITMLVLFRFLISDIFDLLSKNTNEFFSSNQEIVFVYRGQLIGVEELNRIKAAVGEFISINSFLSTSRFRNVAFEFAMSSKNTDYLKRILFEIKIDININLPVDKPFADITKMTYFEREKEVLFMIGSMFKIESVQFNENDDLWIASIALCSEDDYELRDEFKYMRTELVGKVDDEGDRPIATLNNLGNLLLKMGDVDEAEKCHEEMLVELQDEHYDNQDVAGTYIFAQLFRLTGLKQCYIGLRNVAYRRSNNDLGLEYENKAKEIGELLDNILGMIVGKTDDQSNSREPDHEKIARDHWNQNEYDLALENYEKQIEKYSKDGNNESLAECNYHAGCVCIDAEWWDQALKYLQPALDIRISILPKNHEDIANVHFKIGDTYRAKENYTEALEHLEKAYKIYILCLLPEDHKIVKVLSTICQTYYEQKNTTAALPYTNELLKILRKTNPEMAANLENLLHGNGNSQGLSDNVSE